MITTGKERLIERAYAHKAAWLLLYIMVGKIPDAEEGTIPDYRTWDRKPLQQHCSDLEEDTRELLSLLVESQERGLRSSSIEWLAEQFERWLESGRGAFTIATVQQFEQRLGTLKSHRYLDIPPYAEVFLQPGMPAAFRHPEYMLVRDLGLVLDLYRDAETLCATLNTTNAPSWAGAAGENVQALARTVIQTCFNLLESYVSGLARAYVMTHSVDQRTVAKLIETRPSLRQRVRQVPSIIAGRELPLSFDSYPLGRLFDDIKKRRDSFVHCEPGPQESAHGYVKEAAFHDLPPAVVDVAVRATHDLIRHIWRFVHDKEGPRWLPPLEASGRFGKQNLTLRPPSA